MFFIFLTRYGCSKHVDELTETMTRHLQQSKDCVTEKSKLLGNLTECTQRHDLMGVSCVIF